MTEPNYDLAIIGGGINGTGIAADAAGRGLSVVLFEMGDLGGATSSASSKLVHGGLRYLETFAFRLVAEALAEREVLLASAPHIIWPMRFVLPHGQGMRPRAVIRTGLFLYDRLASRQTIPGSEALDLAKDPAGRALRDGFKHGYSYWDCWVDDARLVILNARQAADNGARIETRTRVEAATVEDGLWRIESRGETGSSTCRAKVLVNAAGPWADEVKTILSRGSGPDSTSATLKLVKGSHIVVPRIAGADDAYLLQNRDGRVVFALPYEGSFTLIGTTDVAFDGDPRAAAISTSEEDYLLAVAGRFFRRPLSRADVRWSFAGVRPLYDDGSENVSSVSRDYRLELAADAGTPPVLHVFGGKITTYRRLAEAALGKLKPFIPQMGPAWTAGSTLPGGDVGTRGIEGLRLGLIRQYPGIPIDVLSGLLRRHGTRAGDILSDARSLGDLGEYFGGGLTEREVAYFRTREWARTPDDVLWRRTKAGLHLTAYERAGAADRISKLL